MSMVVYAQSNPNISKSTTEIWSLSLPDSQTYGPMDIFFEIEYHFAKNVQTKELILHYKIKNIKHHVKFGTLRFKKDNIIYREDEMNTIDGLAGEGFPEIKINSLVLNIDVPLLKEPNIVISSNTSTKTVGKNILNDFSIDNLTLDLASSYLEKANFINTDRVKKRIDKLKKK